ncbi:MAG TPA: phosphate ABC transporter permease PtsA [Deltaproteobacteria bacterium]|nr:phosphate ABC transporter permease PtsA [Deltaproteobacteria bacterium]
MRLGRGFIGILGEGLCRATAWLVLAVLVAIIGFIAFQGAGVINGEFLTQAPSHGMERGGIFPAIFGTIALTLLMILMALPLGVAGAIYLNEYAGRSRGARWIRAAINNLAGVPSIVFGLFGVGFFVLFVGRNLDQLLQSGLLFGQPALLWAAATLAVLVLPVIIVTTDEALKAVPKSHREAAYALGATRWQVIRRVVLPQAFPGILTGAILSISRGAGETAPILFTGAAYFLPKLPVTYLFGLIPMINPFDQFMELAYHVFILATQSTNPELTRPLQYGTALVLLTVTFSLNLTAILLRLRYRRRLRRV